MASNTGENALNALYASDDGGNGMEFSSFKTGTSYVVKVLGTADLSQFFNYGIFGKINSFVAENPSTKSKKGYPVDNLTPWDKAWKYHKDKSDKFDDKHGQEASKYKPRQRFAMGFIDLDTGEPIVVDVSKNQAQAIHASIKKNEKKLGKKAFELSKEGSGKNTVVSLMPEDLEDLTDEQRKNFDNAPKEFDASLFEGLSYEADENDMLKSLTQAGFDVTKIGYEVPKDDDEDDNGDGEEPIDTESQDFPF